MSLTISLRLWSLFPHRIRDVVHTVHALSVDQFVAWDGVLTLGTELVFDSSGLVN